MATTGISLIRDHTERLRPPRFLWVPFELGRPFGAPNEPAFQTKVLRTALSLLDREGPPPVLEDFPDEAPGTGPSDLTGWSCPISFPSAPTTDRPTPLDTVLAEIANVSPWHNLALETRGRTSVGAAKIDIEASARFLHDLLEGNGMAANPSPTLTLGQAFRGASEDMKTFYMEAATAQPGQASSQDLATWFWGQTSAGALLLALHPVSLASQDDGVRRVASGQLIPRVQMHRLEKDPPPDGSGP